MSMWVRLPCNSSVVAEYGAYPAYLNFLGGSTTAVHRHLKRGGSLGFEPSVQAAILTAMQVAKRRTFYDVGSHFGFYCALVSTIYRDAQVIAFEPTPETGDLLAKIRDANRLNYVLVRRAVSDVESTLTFYLSTIAETSNSLNAEFRPGAQTTTVKSITLDSVWREGMPLPGVMKIDVETHEAAVLRGGMALLKAAKPLLICEFLAEADSVALRAVLAEIEGLGYRFYAIGANTIARASDLDSMMASIASEERPDWILAPRKLGADFVLKFKAWLAALEHCGKDTLRFVRGNETPPADIAQIYTA